MHDILGISTTHFANEVIIIAQITARLFRNVYTVRITQVIGLLPCNLFSLVAKGP